MSTVTIPQTLPATSLYYKEGSSNKEYHVQIVGSEADGFRVNFQYGRVGSKLQTGTKTKSPVDYETALEIMGGTREKAGSVQYFGLVGEKMQKGYTTGASGTPYQNTEKAGKVSGLIPQLMNEIDEEQAMALINDDAWVMQEKKNGVRQMIKKEKKTLEGINKKGLITSLPESVVTAIKNVCGEANATLDGELVGEVYWLFDMLSIGVHAYADKPYKERWEDAIDWLQEGVGQNFRLVPTAVGKSSKLALFKKLKAENAEGVVFKRLDAKYNAGRPASGGTVLKFKFYATATVRCKFLNDKNSFRMEMLSKGDWVEVGDCTYYPTKYTPKPGDFIEVRYMYAYEGGSIYGPPVLLEQRKDVDDSDCGVSQLKYKQEAEVS